MFWFGRPSYLRRAGAVLLICGAAAIEFWPSGEVLHPFAADGIGAGDRLVVEWRSVPAGLYAPPSLTGMVAAHTLDAGDPIRDSDLTVPLGVPPGWWALSLEVPGPLAPGTSALLVLAGTPGPPVPGIVVTASELDRFAVGGPTALIAVPGEHAADVAVAAADRRVVVLVAP